MTSFPWTLVVAYALCRLFEYYLLKNAQALTADRDQYGADLHRRPLLVMHSILLPARIAGWAMLISAVIKFGLAVTIGVMAAAFLLSLLLQFMLGPILLAALGSAAPVGFLAAVPVMAVVVMIVLATS